MNQTLDEIHPKAPPYRRSMGCLLWVLWKKLTALNGTALYAYNTLCFCPRRLDLGWSRSTGLLWLKLKIRTTRLNFEILGLLLDVILEFAADPHPRCYHKNLVLTGWQNGLYDGMQETLKLERGWRHPSYVPVRYNATNIWVKTVAASILFRMIKGNYSKFVVGLES